MATTNDANVG